MQIDNSGPSIVFDAKTTQAIEEGKNRVTLLQVEELRLSKLNKALEGQIIKLEGDIAYKTTLDGELDSSIKAKQDELEALNREIEKTQNLAQVVNTELDDRVATVQGQETQVREKTTALNKREKALDKKEADLKEKETQVNGDLSVVQDKKAKIETFLKTI